MISRDDTNLHRSFFLGFIKMHILYHASKEPVFGIGIAKELSRHGYSIGPGTLYPTLHRLEEDGYLEGSMEVVGGRVRRYYVVTQKGLAALEEAKAKVRELVSEILEERGG